LSPTSKRKFEPVAILLYANFPFVRLPKLTRKKLVEREAKKLGIQVRKRANLFVLLLYFNVNPDPSFRFNVDSELAIHINVDPDPGSCSSSK
jgi:hypothetical protein